MSLRSPLQSWFDFASAMGNNETQGSLDLQPCSLYGVLLNCSQICSSPDDLFDPSAPQNLQNCGWWVRYLTNVEPRVQEPSRYAGVSAEFASVGFNISNNEVFAFDSDLLAIRGSIVDCISDFTPPHTRLRMIISILRPYIQTMICSYRVM